MECAKSVDRRLVRPSRLHLLAAAFVVLVCCAILVVSGLNEWASRTATLKNAAVDEANLAQSLAQHAGDTFEIADSLVVDLLNRLESDGTSPEALANLQNAIAVRKPSMGRIRGLFVYDDQGRWLATSEKVTDLAAFNNSDREYFRKHRDSASSGLLIGNPVRSRSGGQWIVTASRRFNKRDGSFGGVVLATVDSDYFADFYKRFDVGVDATISLVTANGILIARSVNNETYAGSDISNSPLIVELPSHASQRTYYFRSPFDGLWRQGSYKTSDKYPILVLVSVPQDQVLAEWRRDATKRLALVVGLTSLIAAIGFYLVREMSQRQRMAADLIAKEADFRLLAEESSDMIMRIGLDEKILYISPSCDRILGWPAVQLTGTPALAGVHVEDLPRVRQIVDALKQGDIAETKITYRNRCRSGASIWLETTLHATRRVDTGQVDGVVAISRDMTEHKDFEQRLAALATLDGLTALANRRRFDEKLQEEWARASRGGTPLSLLMIDVDNFGRFNNEYGHQAGDDCLRSVAKILAGEVRRPADVAARYGGEEFALLLPDTDEAGCEAVGGRIRDALHELKLRHALNPPSQIVTASLGGATSWPATNTSVDYGSLVAAADRALYAAKNNGRDRLIMSGQVVPWRGNESA